MIYRLQAANVLPTGLLTNACLDVRRVVKRSQNYVPTELNLPTVRNSSRSNSKEIDALFAGSDVDLVPVTQRLRAGPTWTSACAYKEENRTFPTGAGCLS